VRLVLATVLAALVAAAPATAKQVTETDSLGDIRTELSYVTHKNKTPTGITIKVFDGDEQIVDDAITDDKFFSPAFIFADEDSTRVVDLDGDGIGEAIFDFYTGGAHCCYDTFVYQGAKKLDLFTGNVGYQLKDFDGDGVQEIFTADDAFSAAYSAYAGSLPPIRVLRLRDGEFENFTTDASVAPALRKEIKRFKHFLKRARRDARKDPIYAQAIKAALAGITADYCSLGDCAKGYALFDKLIATGEIRKSFKRQVTKDLRKLGYDS
jgi:hypothetical protein